MSPRSLAIAATIAALGTAVCGAGCGDSKKKDQGDKGATTQAPSTGTSPATEPALPLDPRTQYDLAEAIQRTSALPADDAAEELNEIRLSYQGKRFRWRVYHIPVMCQKPDTCHVLPFDRAGADKNIHQGWMPHLELDGASFDALNKRCADQKRCTLTFQGTLSRFTVSTEEMTSLHFTDVEFVDPAAAEPRPRPEPEPTPDAERDPEAPAPVR